MAILSNIAKFWQGYKGFFCNIFVDFKNIKKISELFLVL